jgi:hypothetical protein
VVQRPEARWIGPPLLVGARDDVDDVRSEIRCRVDKGELFVVRAKGAAARRRLRWILAGLGDLQDRLDTKGQRPTLMEVAVNFGDSPVRFYAEPPERKTR